MKFHLDDEQQQLFDVVRRVASEAEDGRAARNAIDQETYDPKFWQALAELGIGGVCLPSDCGGMAAGLLDLAIVAEALGAAGAPGPFLGHVLAGLAITYAGNAAQRARWLPQMASGELLGTIALEERGGRLHPADWQTTLRDGVLAGDKINILFAPQADLIVVGCSNGELAVVERGAVGLTLSPIDDIDRTRRVWNASLRNVQAEKLTAEGVEPCDRVLDAAFILLAADAVGGANRILNMGVDYATNREQFGGPVGRFQGVKFQFADLAVRIVPIRYLVWYAAYAFDHQPAKSTRTAVIAKSHACDVFMHAAREIVQLHGGIGYTWEYDLQIWLKRAVFDYAFLGTPDVHRARAAGLADW